MKLHQLRYFQCLAHYLHYRKASEALYISQPTLSFAIKELEKNQVLLYLKKKEELFNFLKKEKYSQIMYQKVYKFQMKEFMLFNQKKKLKFHLFLLSLIVFLYLLSFIYKKNNLKSTYNFVVKRQKQLLKKYQKIKDNHLQYIPLIKRKLVIVLSKENPLSKKEKVELKDLLDYPFYTYQKNMTLYSTIKDLFIS